MSVEGNFLYASRGNGNTSSGPKTNYLDIFNISDPSNPTLVNSFSFPATWDTENLLIHNDIVYLSAGGAVISRVDISNPSAPLMLDPLYHEETEGFAFYGVGARDNILYASDYVSSKIFDELIDRKMIKGNKLNQKLSDFSYVKKKIKLNSGNIL